MARSRGDTRRAVSELREAASLLSERGFPGPWGLPQHVPIWYALAQASLASGDDAQAEESFRRITESITERADWPIPYVRSFYFLGQIEEKRGEREKALEHYRRFASLWKEGDMDRDRVIDALRKTQ